MVSERLQRRIERLLERADATADEENWDRVAESAQMVLALDGEHQEALAMLDDPAAAVGHLEDALAFCRENGCLKELAWTCSDYAELLLDRDDTEDSDADGASRASARGDFGDREGPSSCRTRPRPLLVSWACGRSPSASWRDGRG